MKDLDISMAFTIDDIRKIREYNYERRKDMTFNEYKADVQHGANKVLSHIEQIRKEKRATTTSR